MSNSNSPKSLVHLPRSQQDSPSDRLPEGECRFILPDTEADGSRQRCSCVSFTLNTTVPGSQCGCGHQAWHHIRYSTGTSSTVPAAEYQKLYDRCQKMDERVNQMQEELLRERRERDHAVKEVIHLLRGNYSNMAFLRYYVDEKLETLRLHCEDKTEGVLDKAHGATEEVEKLKTRLLEMDETIIRLEERVDTGQSSSGELTPVQETTMTAVPEQPLPQVPAALPIRTDDKHAESWDVRVVLVPSRNQSNAFDTNSVAYRRCQSRGMQQDVHVQDRSSTQFVQCVEAGFTTILRGRSWAPLMCLRSSDLSLTQIPPAERAPSRWDYHFLESQCMAHDKGQGDVIFIALQEVELTWPEIRSLPRVFGSDETCWAYDVELDGRRLQTAVNHSLEFKRASPPRRTGNLKLDTDSIYEYSPPPYSTGSHLDAARISSALGVLAGAATYLADSVPPPQTSPPRPTIGIREDDEHRDKRTKRGALRPEPQPTGLEPIRPIVTSPPQQAAYYYSGRSKRKISSAKAKEPLDWRVSELKFGSSAKSLFHRHDKSKAVDSPRSQQQQPASQQQQVTRP